MSSYVSSSYGSTTIKLLKGAYLCSTVKCSYTLYLNTHTGFVALHANMLRNLQLTVKSAALEAPTPQAIPMHSCTLITLCSQ